MGRWDIETRAWQQILTHYCDKARPGDTNEVLRQDIGGGYVRCARCGESYLPEAEPGNPRLLMRIKPNEAVEATTAVVVSVKPVEPVTR